MATPRWGLQRALVYWGVLSLGPAFLLIGIWSSVYLIGLPLLGEVDALDLRSAALRYLPSLLMFGGFTALYVAVPNSPVRLLHGVLGGLATTVVFQLASKGFTMASQYFIYDAIYGAFAALPVFLLWLHVVWVMVLGGAIFVRALSLHGAAVVVDEPLLIKAIRVVQVVVQGHGFGQPTAEPVLFDRVGMTVQQRTRIYRALRELRLIDLNAQRQWILGRNL